MYIQYMGVGRWFGLGAHEGDCITPLHEARESFALILRLTINFRPLRIPEHSEDGV